MKKRILSLVLCAAMLLSMCLFLGAGVAEATSDTAADTTESASAPRAVNFTNVAPFGPAVTGVSPLRARSVIPLGLDDSTTGSDNGMVINKTATANSNGTYTIQLEAYATGSKVITEVKEDIPTDIVLVLDQSGSMADCIVCGGEMDGDNDQHPTGYQKVSKSDISRDRTYYVIVDGSYQKVTWSGGFLGFGRGWYDDNGVKRDPNSYAFYQATGYEACTSRLSALKTALNNFTAAVRTKALGTDGQVGTEDDVDHRIAMVGFASDERGNTEYQNTELLTTSPVVNYTDAKETDYKNALVPVLDEKGNLNSRIVNAVSGLAASGGTAIDLGTEMANKVLEQHKNDTEHKNDTGRNKVVIIFTDGVPGIKTDDSDEKRDEYANRAIANTLKAKRSATEASAPGYGATVYTVGVFDGADASTPGQLSNATNWGDNGRPNRFMHLLSSNYPVAENMSTTGAVKSDLNGKSYYLSAADAKSLKNIFQQISDQIETGGSSSTLTAEAVVKDVISPQFALPEGATADNITLKTYACTGKDANGKLTFNETANADAMGATATVEGSNVSVTGFNFSGNWCGTETSSGGETHHGNKLVISFTVSPKAGFLGGNNVYTNDSAGVYVDSAAETPLLTFDRPTVNVRIKDVSVRAEDKNVYLLEDLTAAELKNGATVKVGNVSLDLSQENYGLAAWQTAYVKIEVTITDKDGKGVTTDGLSGLKEDTTYTVTVKVSPKETATDTTTSGAEATVQSGSISANVNVYKPVLTYKDSEVYYGEAVPTSYTSNLESTVWKHGDTEAPTSMGTAPDLSLTYTPETDKIANDKINTRQDVGVGVAVMINGTDVTDSVSFKHTDCVAGTPCTVPKDCEFVLHVKTCSLTITKKVTGDDGWDKNQTFVFNVKDGDNVVTTVVLKADGRKTITGLPVGTYTVEEDTNWSWSFKTDNGNQTVTLSSASDNETVDVVNKFTQKNWLTSIADVINTWISGDAKQK